MSRGGRPKFEDSDLSAAPATVDSLEAMLHEAVAAPPAYPALEPGAAVAGRYAIERVIGAGGMGTVYLARDMRLDRDVALKLHRSASGAGRLRREAIAMAKLAHPNVVGVFDVGELGGRPFVAMEYVPGTTLRAYLGERERPPRAILAMLLAAGEGLAAAHDVELVHRDVKPDNIFVGTDGRVRIGDFGLAQVAGARGAPAHALPARIEPREVTGTLPGAIVGTPAYMAPEQLDGRELDARTDQFAFCVVAWEALTGERPFPGETPEALREAIARGEPRPGKRRVPARLRRVLARGMAADPRDRWPSLRAVLARLRAAERRPRVLAAGAAALAAGAAAAWLAWPAADRAAACAGAGREIDELLPSSMIDAAAAAIRGAGRADAAEEIGRIARAAEQHRADYRAYAGQICRAEARGQWTAELAAAGRECLGYVARTSRELFATAPGATSQTSDLVQIVTELPPLARCADPKLLAGWSWLASDPAQLDRIVAARARLDAAAVLADLGQLPAARAIRDDLAASPVQTEPAVALRLDLLRGAIALHENRLAAAVHLLEDVYVRSRAQDDGPVVLRTASALIDLAGRARRDAAAAHHWTLDGLGEAERHRAVLPGPVFDLQITAAAAIAAVGDAAGALALAERAEPLAEGDKLRLAKLAAVRARLYDKLGRSADALAGMAAAIETHRDVLGARHPRVADLYAQYATILGNAEKPREAHDAAMKAKEILDGAGADDSAAVARAEHSLGVALLEAEDPRAADHLERARKIWVASFGEDHPDVALADLNLAIVHSDRGEHAQAAALLRRALEIQTRMLGPEHGDIAASLYNLAVVEREAGKLDDALATARRSAEIFAKQQRGSRRHALALTHISLIQNMRGSFPEALAIASEVLAMPSAEAKDQQTGAWARIQAAHALIGLKRDPARARVLLAEARARYSDLLYSDPGMKPRLDEIASLLARLR